MSAPQELSGRRDSRPPRISPLSRFRIARRVEAAASHRAWKFDQTLLLPVSVQEERAIWRGLRRGSSLGILIFARSRRAKGSERAQPPFDPVMMTALLLYAYCKGVYSLRRIAKAARERSQRLNSGMAEYVRDVHCKSASNARASARSCVSKPSLNQG